MKRLLGAFLIIWGIFLSCATEDKSFSEEHPQKWELVKMTGNTPNSETTGVNMAWQEFYELNSDSTFLKSRTRANVLTEATGTYTFVILSNKKYLELTYGSANDLIGNCLSEPKEHLQLNSMNRLIGTWQACDGPGLEYKRAFKN